MMRAEGFWGMRKGLATFAKIALTVGLLWLLVQKVDIAHAWDEAKAIALPMLVAAFGIIFVQLGLAALRWRLVLRALGGELSFWQATQIFWIGNFFGLVLPGAVGGDAVRAWKTIKAGVPMALAINSVMLERVATVFGLILLVALTQPLIASRLQDTSSLWVFPTLSVVSVAGIALLTQLDRLPTALGRWRVFRAFGKLAHDTRVLFLRPKTAAWILVAVIIGHLNLALGVYALAAGMGVAASLLDCVVLVPPVVLIMTLPISIAGWGARELAMVTIFGFIGVPAAQALALSVMFGLINTVSALPGGVFWLFSRDRQAEDNGTGTPQDLAV
jgi:glycosyltransferase 2 family protein